MDRFALNNQIEKLSNNKNTCFLNQVEVNTIINRIRKTKIKYKIFQPFENSENIIIYTNNVGVTLFELKTKSKLTHREVLGALFSHNLQETSFGDIIIGEKYYLIVLDELKKYMINNFTHVGKKKVILEEKPLEEVKDFQIQFEDLVLNTTTMRIDSIISKLAKTSRNKAQEYIKEKKIIVNYELLKNQNYMLKENDIFSIKNVGKFKIVNSFLNSKNKYKIYIKKYK